MLAEFFVGEQVGSHNFHKGKRDVGGAIQGDVEGAVPYIPISFSVFICCNTFLALS